MTDRPDARTPSDHHQESTMRDFDCPLFCTVDDCHEVAIVPWPENREPDTSGIDWAFVSGVGWRCPAHMDQVVLR